LRRIKPRRSAAPNNGLVEFKDYYAALGVQRTATQDEIKRAYRKLARKYHPDVSKEPDAEARFKEVAEAHEALHDPEKRAAYDDLEQRRQRGPQFQAPPDWGSGYEFSGRAPGPRGERGFSEFFTSMFGAQASPQGAGAHRPAQAGDDHHAKVAITVEESYLGARRTVSLRMPVAGADGLVTLREHQIEVTVPKGVYAGQHLRLAGQGGPGTGGALPGDLYLEVTFQPHPRFRVDGRDVYLDLPVSPWEAALGATLPLATPDGKLELNIAPGSAAGRKLRLKGRGLPGTPPGDLYAVLKVVLPAAETTADREALGALARAFPGFDPRATALAS
jgi:curved DNA-binding protein